MAYIFDLDGTLLNTLDDLGNCCNRALINFGYKPHPLESYKFFVGNGMQKLVKRALPKDVSDNDYQRVLNYFLEDYALHFMDDSKPYDGVVEALESLNRKGVPIAICTNKRQDYTDSIVVQYFSTIKFVKVIGDRFDGKHKPNPSSALEIAQAMGVDTSKIYFVGDSNVDMQTAINANMTPIGVSWGFRPVDELIENGAKLIINSMRELPDF